MKFHTPRTRQLCWHHKSNLVTFGSFRKLLFASIVFFAAVNVLARVVMKDVANCGTHCELRSSGNQQTVERMLWPVLRQAAPGSVFKYLRTLTVALLRSVAQSTNVLRWWTIQNSLTCVAHCVNSGDLGLHSLGAIRKGGLAAPALQPISTPNLISDAATH